MCYYPALSSITSWFWVDLLQYLRRLLCWEDSHSLKRTPDNRFFCFQLPLESLRWNKIIVSGYIMKYQVLALVFINLRTKFPTRASMAVLQVATIKTKQKKVRDNQLLLNLKSHCIERSKCTASMLRTTQGCWSNSHCERDPFHWLTSGSTPEPSCKAQGFDWLWIGPHQHS